MKLFEKTGKMALGSRLRLMTARITDDAAKIYELYDVEFSPKWFPVFFVLSEDGENTITEIANEIGHSQPSVSKIIQEMTGAGLVQENRESPDKRRNVVALTKKGKRVSERIRVQCADVDAAIGSIISEARHNLWEAIEEWEFLLEQKSLLRRVQEQKKLRESKDVRIVNYEDRYQAAFKSLNEEWISTYFQMEEADYKALDNPKGYILDRGGKIFVALYNNEPVGVCALIKMDDPDYDFELAKMAVSPKIQGKSIGWLLGQAVVNAAKELGASQIYLESNTALKPAINLYQKLGFRKVVGRSTPYERCNIQMELQLK
ncbi:transcriptional regulator, MarR family with acetyltransferase activity [Chitinophaga sp. YR573]|uniref:bifunctional helix-turn-helix transcriptional regulator/GNAT family N-acetyltransferase n=1 Tax=Chitinophaga sp. YR573 TaxID=1881040 RepID=UPI0008D2FC32|nr:helix-turn-helix domain-containing GNAT family N-acetyltransferase [Chitinophaga sp. YR573]SEW17379.1 transcriptional regulator, MarR family with acetyltransferase activity [Chitinophaga sp. YR573]